MTDPVMGPSGSADHGSHRPITPVDLSHISLEPTWLPPTPFSLPATPNQSPFIYPSDVPNYELVDARLLGYHREDWQDINDHLSQPKRQPLPSNLDDYSSLTGPLAVEGYTGPLSLTSASISVHYDARPTNADVSPYLLSGTHQLALLRRAQQEPLLVLPSSSLDAPIQKLIRDVPSSTQIYLVDLPIHLPASQADRLYLAYEVGFNYHVKAHVNLSMENSNAIQARKEQLEATSDVYFVSPSGNGNETPELLSVYQESVPVRNDRKGASGSGSLIAHGLAGAFAAKLWADMVEEPKASDAGKSIGRDKLFFHFSETDEFLLDLSCYIFVQKIVHESGRPHVLIIYTPRVVSSLQEATVKQISQEEVASPVEMGALRTSSPTHDDLQMDLPTPKPGNLQPIQSPVGSRPGVETHYSPKAKYMLGTSSPRYTRRRFSTPTGPGPVRTTKSFSVPAVIYKNGRGASSSLNLPTSSSPLASSATVPRITTPPVSPPATAVGSTIATTSQSQNMVNTLDTSFHSGTIVPTSDSATIPNWPSSLNGFNDMLPPSAATDYTLPGAWTYNSVFQDVVTTQSPSLFASESPVLHVPHGGFSLNPANLSPSEYAHDHAHYFYTGGTGNLPSPLYAHSWA